MISPAVCKEAAVCEDVECLVCGGARGGSADLDG